MKLKPLSIALATLLMAGTSASWAATTSDFIFDDDDDDEEDGVIELSDTYVRPELTDIERLRKTKEVIILDKKKLQDRGNRDVTDALKKIPSVNVNSSGKKQIDIRGQGMDAAARNIQIHIDGAPITSLTTHPFARDINIVPIEQLDSVEIIPGGGSVIYGAGAQGGVINMTTSLHSMKKPRKMVSGQWGTDSTRYTAALGHAFFDNKFAIEATATKTRQDLEFVNTYDNSDYYALGARLDLPGNHRVTFRASRYEAESQYVWNLNKFKLQKYGRNYLPRWKTQTKLGPDGKIIRWKTRAYNFGDRNVDTLSATHTWNASDAVKLTTEFFTLDGTYRGDDWEKHFFKTKDYGLKSKLDFDYNENGHLLVGLDLSKQQADLDYFDVVDDNPSDMRFFYEKRNYALFIVNTNTWDKFELSEGIREDITDWRYQKTFKDDPYQSGRKTRNEAFSLSAAYNYSETGRVYSRYERGFTGPDGLMVTDEAYRKDPTATDEHGNPVWRKTFVPTTAKDEKFDIAEIGWRDAFDLTTVSLTAWMSHTPNQMVRALYNDPAYDNKSVYYTKNLFDVKRRGFDLKFNQKFGRLELEESYSHLWSKTSLRHYPNELPPSEYGSTVQKAKGLLRVPRHKFVFTAKLNLRDNLSVEGTYLYQGGYTTSFGKNGQPDELLKGYDVVDLALYWEPRSNIKISAGVTNLFNKEYFQYGGGSSVVIAPERAFFAGLKATF